MKTWGYIWISLIFSACQQVVVEPALDSKKIKNISVSIEQDDQTRLFVKDVNNNSAGMQTQNFIENDDTIGIFPQAGDQIPFIISGMASPQTNFTFMAEAWGLLSGVKYYAYIPFDRSMNFRSYNNVESVYLNYFGQEMDKDMSNADGMYDQMDYTGKKQSYYSYMYSEPTEDLTGSGNLNFQMRYVGGWQFVYLTINNADFAPGQTRNDTYFILAKIVATKPIFKVEGFYNLKQVADNRLALNQKMTSANITPTYRGLTNVITVKLDSVQCISADDDMFLSFAMPPVDYNEPTAGGVDCTVYLYDSEANYYLPWAGAGYNMDALNGKIEDGYTHTLMTPFKYCGKARPEDLRIEPWEPEDETVNSNWNYK